MALTTLQSSVLGPGPEDPVVVNISATDVQLLQQCQLVSVWILLSVVSYWLSVEETASALCHYWHCSTWHGHIQQCPSQHAIHSYCIQVLWGLLCIVILNLSIMKHDVVIKYWHCFFRYKQVACNEKKRWCSTSFFDGSLVSLKVDDSWPTSHTLVSFLNNSLLWLCTCHNMFNYAQIYYHNM